MSGHFDFVKTSWDMKKPCLWRSIGTGEVVLEHPWCSIGTVALFTKYMNGISWKSKLGAVSCLAWSEITQMSFSGTLGAHVVKFFNLCFSHASNIGARAQYVLFWYCTVWMVLWASVMKDQYFLPQQILPGIPLASNSTRFPEKICA